jgi:hypothetical protein
VAPRRVATYDEQIDKDREVMAVSRRRGRVRPEERKPRETEDGCKALILLASWKQAMARDSFLRRIGVCAVVLVLCLLDGCANTALKPYVDTFASTAQEPVIGLDAKPEIAVRPAKSEEEREIEFFPGKEEFEASARKEIAALSLAVPFMIPGYFLSGVWVGDAWSGLKGLHKEEWERQEQEKERQQKKEFEDALQGLRNMIKGAIESKFRPDAEAGKLERLEIIYVAGVRLIGPEMGDRCFVLHAKVEFRREERVVQSTTLHLDPRVVTDGNTLDCIKKGSVFGITHLGEEVLPRAIRRRFPELPWASGTD